MLLKEGCGSEASTTAIISHFIKHKHGITAHTVACEWQPHNKAWQDGAVRAAWLLLCGYCSYQVLLREAVYCTLFIVKLQWATVPPYVKADFFLQLKGCKVCCRLRLAICLKWPRTWPWKWKPLNLNSMFLFFSSTGRSKVEVTYDRMYTVTSWLKLTVTREDDGVPVVCIVDHPAVKDFQAQTYLEVLCE